MHGDAWIGGGRTTSARACDADRVPIAAGDAVALAEPWYPAFAEEILVEAEARFSRRGFACRDHLSRLWLRRAGAPYLAELDDAAARMGRPGVHFLNLSFEWGCTVAVEAGEDGLPRLRRVFDWGPESLCRTLYVVRRTTGDGGSYLSLTWPLFCGEATILRPGCFAIALNQMNRVRTVGRRPYPERLNRLLDLAGFLASRAIPPAFLLRRVAERAGSAAEAAAMLSTVPVSTPAIFSLAGPTLDESCVIERCAGRILVRRGGTVAANHPSGTCNPAGLHSRSIARADAMESVAARGGIAEWCRPPLRHEKTRFAAVLPVFGEAVAVQRFQGLDLYGGETVVPLAGMSADAA